MQDCDRTGSSYILPNTDWRTLFPPSHILNAQKSAYQEAKYIIMTSTASNIVFDDIFTITAIDKEGKKFERGLFKNAHKGTSLT
jgi:hypothetical protein